MFVAGHRQPAEAHAAVAAINAKIGAPIDYFAEAEDPRAEQGWTPHSEQIKAFVAAGGADVKAVLVLGANPVLTAPADLKIADVLSKAKVSIHAGMLEDETGQACGWHLPMAHYLEAWGDVRSVDGTVSVAQPLIEPLFGGKSAIEILALLAGHELPGEQIIKETARAEYLTGIFSEWNWKKALFEGVVANSAWKPVAVAADAAKATAAIAGNLAFGECLRGGQRIVADRWRGA